MVWYRVWLGAFLLSSPLAAQGVRPPVERCEPAPAGWSSANDWLSRSRQALGFPVGDSVLSYQATDVSVLTNQSDRWYPPFAAMANPVDNWFDPRSQVERLSSSGGGPAVLITGRAGAVARDTVLRPYPQGFSGYSALRGLNPWAVLADWSAASDVRVTGRCWVRDYWRVALSRRGFVAEDRLYLDPVSAYPVQLSVEEPHYLWGRARADYRYLTWYDPLLPVTASREVDGIAEAYRSYAASRLVPRDSAPSIKVPDALPDMRGEIPLFLQALPPDTIRVTPSLFLLRNRGYAEAVTLIRDTLWILDATQSEQRAGLDSAWVGKLFPGRHALMVVVTDVAWPHIAGVRYWVAQGATIVSHRMSEEFLKRVIDRRWTGAPDLLERRRAQARFRFRAIDQATELAGGALRLVPLQGLGSEGGLVVWIPGERFLWAGDYIQLLDRPSLYAREMLATMRAAGIEPERFGAQHVGVAEWKQLVGVNPGR